MQICIFIVCPRGQFSQGTLWMSLSDFSFCIIWNPRMEFKEALKSSNSGEDRTNYSLFANYSIVPEERGKLKSGSWSIEFTCKTVPRIPTPCYFDKLCEQWVWYSLEMKEVFPGMCALWSHSLVSSCSRWTEGNGCGSEWLLIEPEFTMKKQFEDKYLWWEETRRRRRRRKNCSTWECKRWTMTWSSWSEVSFVTPPQQPRILQMFITGEVN